MNNPKILKTVIAALVVALLTSLGLLVQAHRQSLQWQSEVQGLSGFWGSTRAKHDLLAGTPRLFVIAGDRKTPVYSGTHDGSFEVWYPEYYTENLPSRFSTEQMVLVYNEKMKYLHDHPDQLLTSTNSIKL
jgi:hypothetical protein